MKVVIGINENARKTVAKELSKLLADTYLLYLKTQNFHWNVTGELFPMLHKLFEDQYELLADAVDLVAERIRALGEFAPATFHQFQGLSSIKESETIPTAHKMIQQLSADHEIIIRSLRDMITVAEKADDEASMDLMIERLRDHEKIAWMLRSSL